jgi:hypothetical protein
VAGGERSSVNRQQLAHILRASSRIVGDRRILVIGSQAILAGFDVDELPEEATRSIEADIAFWDDPGAEKSDDVDGAIGELSPFHESHGYYAQGVSVSTAVLPDGWRDRLVKVSNANTAAPGGKPRYTGWCLDKEDLCVAKLCAFREKDQNFVAALIDAGLVDPGVITARLATVPTEHRPDAERGLAWLAARS